MTECEPPSNPQKTPTLSAQGTDSAVPHLKAKTRLAPSPTGALHLGNARTFLINWALAKQRGWRIILRIEDLDTPRVKSGVADAMLRTLEALGLTWDEGPTVQSENLEPYREAMRALVLARQAYRSVETRGEIEADRALSAPQEGVSESVFPASKRPTEFAPQFTSDSGSNWRFATPDQTVRFADEFAGPQQQAPSKTVGDFVIWTKRNQPSYQLAVVVDDARQGVTHVVRGNDLLDSAARQMLLMTALGISQIPVYFHLPLVRGSDGKRLAKRHGDTRLETYLNSGVRPERIIALLARWSGIDDAGNELSAAEFTARFDLVRVPREDVVFTPQDDEWLRRGSRRNSHP